MIRLLALLSVAVASSGCVSSPVGAGEATQVPTTNVYQSKVLVPGLDKGEIILTRDDSFGGKCALGVYLDGELVAAIEREQRLVMYAAGGEHILGAGPNPNGRGFCNWYSDSRRRETSINTHPGKTARYRLAMISGEIRIMPTAFD